MDYVSDNRTPVAAGRTASASKERTWINHDAVAELRRTVIPAGTKGIPLDLGDGSLTLGQLADSGWQILEGGMPMPVMVLKDSALTANIAAMASYCEAHGVSLCPHGKTTMSPQLFERQIEAGAWGLTAATPAHLRLYREFGVQRIFYANQLVEPAVIHWVVRQLASDPDFEFLSLVDSVESVELLDRGALAAGATRPLSVLLEVGLRGGRCGVRDFDTARVAANAVEASFALDLCGVECFEGLPISTSSDPVGEVLGFANKVAAQLVETTSLREREEVLVSAGGSAYFDRVIDTFVNVFEAPNRTRVILRSGCYVTNDGGFYAETSPLARGGDDSHLLRDALEIWSVVLSRPEEGRVICSMGRRDAPEDMGLPKPTRAMVSGTGPTSLHGASIVALSDQHGHLDIPPHTDLAPGDLVGCSISHPCTAFDKWKVIPVVDEQYFIRDAITTHF